MAQENIVKQTLKTRGTLGKSELLALGVGQVIGAGVITLVGQAVGLTGRSAWLAYAIAVVIGFIMVIPYVFLSSAIIVKGGSYSVIKAMSGERLAGMYVVSYITQCLSLSLMGTSLGIYLQSLWPVLEPRVVAVVFLLLFYGINLLGISSMAKVQRAMSAILVLCLLMFIVAGLFKLDSAAVNFAHSEFFTGGTEGFVNAIFLYVYSVTGYWMNINYASDAKNPKKDVPWSIIMVVPIIMIIYVGVALVGGGVLPPGAGYQPAPHQCGKHHSPQGPVCGIHAGRSHYGPADHHQQLLRRFCRSPHPGRQGRLVPRLCGKDQQARRPLCGADRDHAGQPAACAAEL
mgnify:CR=1 FL=1